VKFVQLGTGESIPCDLVIAAIGSELCTELYQNSPLEMTDDGFVRVNYRLETSVEHVLAVGDICRYPLKVFDLEDINWQHWQMACSTGHQAGKKLDLLADRKSDRLFEMICSDLKGKENAWQFPD
jgi:thioredoxin reductase